MEGNKVHKHLFLRFWVSSRRLFGRLVGRSVGRTVDVRLIGRSFSWSVNIMCLSLFKVTEEKKKECEQAVQALFALMESGRKTRDILSRKVTMFCAKREGTMIVIMITIIP